MTSDRFFLVFFLGIYLICLSSCLLGPEYDRGALRRAGLQGKSDWKAGSPATAVSLPLDRDWWKAFQDSLSDQYMEEALSGNPDLAVRLLRVREADLTLGENRSRRLPRLNQSASASYYWRRQERLDVSFDPIFDPEEDFENRLEESTTSVEDSEYYNLGLSLNWELDLWGKKKRSYLGAEAGYAESQAQYVGEYLRIGVEVLKTVFDIRKQDLDKRIVEELARDASGRLAVYQNQFAEGLIPEWRVLRQRADVENIEKEILEAERNRHRLENRLAVLVGRNPGELTVPDTGDDSLPDAFDVPPGLPSDLLVRRPDIIAAEYRVEKAVHQVGENIAARLPTISLTGQAGLANTAIPDLLKKWTLGLTPSLSFPLFDGGAGKTRVLSSEIQSQIARIEYRNTVLKAFEEVENLLNDQASRKRELGVATSKVAAMRRIREETGEKFRMGLVSQLEVLDIQRELLAAERALLGVQRSRLDDALSLAKALGGGWSAEEPIPFRADGLENGTSTSSVSASRDHRQSASDQKMVKDSGGDVGGGDAKSFICLDSLVLAEEQFDPANPSQKLSMLDSEEQ
jgi:NodT family efflux transporter outer membrane factor (OMF) lipoprotein